MSGNPINTERIFGKLLLIVVLAVLALPGASASAHTSFPAGPYTVEIGWLNEPPVAGQPNAIVVNLSGGEQSTTEGGATQSAAPVKIDTSGLTLQVAYGDQTKALTLQPQSEDSPNHLMGVMTPSVMGKYTVRLSGKLNGDLGPTDVSISNQPEEVVGVDAVQFPNPADNQANSSANAGPGWLPIAALAAGGLGIILAVIALVRK